MIIHLTGLMCNGKTSMIKEIKKLIMDMKKKHNLFHGKIAVIKEPIGYFLDNTIFHVENKDLLQNIYLSISLAQLDSVKEFYDQKKDFVIMDRNILDVIAWSRVFNNQIIPNIEMKLMKYELSMITYIFDLPKDDNMILKCLEHKNRQILKDYTINEIRELNERFKREIIELQDFFVELPSYIDDKEKVLNKIREDIEWWITTYMID